MSLYTSNYFTQLAARRTSFITEQQRSFAGPIKESATFDVFLSHSFLDRQEVYGIYIELKDAGYSVYVDWIVDHDLDRTNVTTESAERIRKRMRASKSLILAMSANAQMSKWIPWELGFMDGHTKKCSLLPLSKDSIAPKKFERSEYLLLYPYIKKATINYSDDMYITESANRYVSLDRWVKKNASPEYNTRDIDIL